MKYFFTILFLISIVGIFGQLGIKTKPIYQNYQRNQNQSYEFNEQSMNQYQNVHNMSQYQNVHNTRVNRTGYERGSDGHFITYDLQYPPLQNGSPLRVAPQPIYFDKTAQFLNETRSKMATGVCYEEVPTATLVREKAEIPRGNGSDPTLSKIRVCCAGYERNVHNFLTCDPICKNDCINGVCVAPEVCVCYPDHIRNYGGFCLATCPIGCGNGICQEDGSCQCKPGYALDLTSKKFCAPVCSNGCHNGNCTAPDLCECSVGYELDDHNNCIPKCDNCENGKCIEPGVCNCLTGYQRKGDKCEAICREECKNGFCAAPDICGCNPGWILDVTARNCIAHCDKPCLNGYCNGNNVCACHKGYIQDEFNANLCRPDCPGGCPNGFCSGPNLCLCKAGFVKSGIKGRTQCVPV